ncbi:MAG: tRNA (adenosine(37)-N6)-dimethylallyltransferase MiaA, partial [Firmicutes bacterium]|nr:tRNA (adenosine(37)-N6)-dimethylallyltransferase MiaA [Bacillota bacterium]
LYIRAATRPFLFPDVGARPEIRAALTDLVATIGPQGLHRELAAVDPEAAARIHPHALRRIIRALEVYRATGLPISFWQRSFGGGSSPYETVYVCLTREREELYRRIEARAEAMIAAGLVEEVRQLLAAGYGRNLPAMQGLGYREIVSYLAGETSLSQAVATMKKRTRHYAKRQLTWFRKEPVDLWLDLTGFRPQKPGNEFCPSWQGDGMARRISKGRQKSKDGWRDVGGQAGR